MDNPKTLRDKLVRSKLKLTDNAERGNFPCGRGNCEIYNILKPGKGFKSTVTWIIKWTFILIVTAYALFTWFQVKCVKTVYWLNSHKVQSVAQSI